MRNDKGSYSREVVALVVKELKNRGYEISSTKIQKLLYLIDYYHKKFYNKKFFSGLIWKYHHFGPYNEEIVVITSEEFQPFDYRNFMTLEVNKDEFTSEFNRVFNYVMRNFGNSPLDELLDFVYFETEPMLNAKRGEILNFKHVEPRPEITIPKEKAEKLLNSFKKLSVLMDNISVEGEIMINDNDLLSNDLE